MRFSLGSSDVLTRVALLLSNGREKQDKTLDNLLRSGVMETVVDKPASNSTQPGEKEDTSIQHVVNPQ